MNARIAQLLRSNIALALLCVISAGVLYSAWKSAHALPAENPKVIQMQAAASPEASPRTPSATQALAAPDFERMPAPSSFTSFEYHAKIPIVATSTCADAYRVILIYRSSVDYRPNPNSASINRASKCDKGTDYSDDIDPASFHASEGDSFYVIRASQGQQGTWHDPY